MIKNVSPPSRDYVSFSAIRTFQACPLRYRYRYLDRLPEECVSSSLVFGAAIHSAIEMYFCEQLAGEQPDREALLDAYRRCWQERSNEAIRFGKTETADALYQLAHRMLGVFLNSDLARPKGRIVGVEEELRGELSTELPDLLGRVDLLLECEDSVGC